MTTYSFARDVAVDDWRALPRAFKKGETIHRFTGYDYGVARDDAMLLGVEVISCSITGGTPFFTVPTDMLLDESGNRPRGDYLCD